MDKEEWLKRYKARMMERGLTEKEAEEVTKVESEELANDFEKAGCDSTPEDSADEELSYWTSDG